MLLVVNYHYVREVHTSKYPSIFAVTPTQLRQQLEIIGKHFSIIKPEELIRLYSKGEDIRDRLYCLITFDDGLKEQYTLAKPVLDSLNIKAVFFVNGSCIEKKKVNTVHKIHWIRSIIPPGEFIEIVESTLRKANINVPVSLENFKPVEGQNIYDTLEVRYIKYLLNHMLPSEIIEKIIEEIYKKYNDNEAGHSNTFYMNKDMISDLADKLMVGSHGYEHNVKSQISESEIIEDLQRNQILLKELTGKRTHFISYPYGGKNAVSLKVGKCAADSGHSVGFTIERAVNLSFSQPLLLARFDTNDAPAGRSPLLNIDNKRCDTIPPATFGRKWFFDETEECR
jgi:peptidoglycan/xylan/chitin deacetylase (PgdA/CDA1 family)